MRILETGIQFIYRLEMQRDSASFSELFHMVERLKGDIIAIDVVSADEVVTVRDMTVIFESTDPARLLHEQLNQVPGLNVENVSDRTFLMHLGGKIEIQSRVQIKTRADLSHVYTPGVARVVEAISDDPSKAFQLTMKRNMVAVITDGSAILGLGNRGALAALPVMEGKAVLFKTLAGVDAFPICLDTQDPDEIIETVMRLAPGFGGINLEDISAPRCFTVEKALKERLDIPVFHDDQHGTAVVIAAALINAAKIVKKDLTTLRVVIVGIGAAGTATTELLLHLGVTDIVGVDREGAIVRSQHYPDHPSWEEYARHTNPEERTGGLSDVLVGADVFIGVSAGNILSAEQVQSMAADPIIFALANPIPEIAPDVAQQYAAVVATGRSDFPNQVNNVLCFPGLFRGVLDCRAREINTEMKVAAAQAIADVVLPEELSPEYIIPSVFNRKVSTVVAKAVAKAAEKTGVSRKALRSTYMK